VLSVAEVLLLTDRVYVHTTFGVYQKTVIPSNEPITKTSNSIVLVDTRWDTNLQMGSYLPICMVAVL